MNFKGEFEVKKDRPTVSAFVSDIEKVTSVIPDVQSVERIDKTSSRLVVKAGQSAIKGKFNLLLEVKNRIDDQSVEISAKGSGATGSLNLKATYDFSDSTNGTTLVKWNVEITIGGVIATMGSRVINNTAEKYISVLTDSFREAFEK